MSDTPKPPPLSRLPTELHIHIISFLTTEVLRCCLTKIGPYCSRGRFTWHGTAHDVSSTDHETDPDTVAITHPAILLLRSTNTYFLNLIPLSQSLLLQIECHPETPRTMTGPLRACCVCLRLRPSHEFAISAHSGPQQSPKRYVNQSLDYWARRRFCRDCGFHAYPHPHPALSPRRRRVRRVNEPVGMTTYAPGTTLVFLRSEPHRRGHVRWVWCLDCRLLKTYTGAAGTDCGVFCKECCARLECWVSYHPSPYTRQIYREHRGYAGIAEEVTAETNRRKHRLSVGAVYVAQGTSLLLKNVEQPFDEKEEDVGDDEGDKVWRVWFDLEGYPALLRTPPSHMGDPPDAPPRRRRLPYGAFQVCALFRPPISRHF